MAPEMAAAYVIGMLPSLSVTGLHLYLHQRKMRKPEYQQLQINLQKIDQFWCETQSKILKLREGSLEKDRIAFRRSILMMGLLFAFLSWLGFFFNLLVLLSMHKLAISRFEQKVFASDLAKRNLDAETTAKLCTEFKSLAV